MIRYAFLMALATVLNAMGAVPTAAQDVLPRREALFNGLIARTVKDSKPDFPKEVEPPGGAPNVLLIMTDDVGFGASSTFGGPIPTVTVDRLAATGLRYTQFHTTAMCSPTRAALLTGRNHHTAHSGIVTELATGFPGYDSVIPASVGSVAEVLRRHGYATSMYGKHHNVPEWHFSLAGPFDLWPSGIGFEYFYGFLGGDTNQWQPALFENTRPVSPPHDDPSYILDRDLADRAIDWIRVLKAVAPRKPFFVYFAPGTAHAPHHAPKEWIARFKGQFDHGWDAVRQQTFARQQQMGIIPAHAQLTPRPQELPAWDPLSAEEKRLYARMMEVYAAALAHCDHQIGRVLDAIEQLGELDNTLVVFIQGDNGASGEGTLHGTTNEIATVANGLTEDIPSLLSRLDELGGPQTYNHYPAAWAHAMNTPFQWTKQVASHFGGTRNGVVMAWPRRITARGEIRAQFHHVIDIVPTILEAAAIRFPAVLNGVAQKPIEGVSMAYSWDQPNAPSARTTQYFELAANRAIYDDGWVAATTPRRLPWMVMAGGAAGGPDAYDWELYHVAEDFSEANNLAQSHPQKLRELQELWAAEAVRYSVLPLDDRLVERGNPALRPSLTRGRTEFTYYPGMARIPERAAPDVKNRSYTITADVEIPKGGASGVLATQGGHFGGWALLVLDGKPLFVHALSHYGHHKYRVASTAKLRPGKHTIRFEFAYDGGVGMGGTGTLLVDGKTVAHNRIERTVRGRFSLDETFDVGEDTGTPVIPDYRIPATFTGVLQKVVIELGPEQVKAAGPDAPERIGQAPQPRDEARAGTGLGRERQEGSAWID